MSVSSSAPVESISRGSSSGMPGSTVGLDPAAMMQCLKPTLVVPSAPSTESRLGDVNVPLPRTTSTLRCLASPVSPPVSLSTTESFQPRSLSTSISGLPNVIPCSADSSTSAITRAMCSSAFDGMQPTLRQTPPRRSWRSTSTVLSPRSAARNAAV